MLNLDQLLKGRLAENPQIAYLFITDHGKVMAHTFAGGLPPGILHANGHTDKSGAALVHIDSGDGQRYVDMALPMFDNHKGLLRIGFYEASLMPTIQALWIQSGVTSLLVLSLTLLLGFFIIRRFTRPLRRLSMAAHTLDNKNLNFLPQPSNQREINILSSSFTNMVEQVRSYSTGLESRTLELDRAYRLIFHSFDMIRTMGNHSTLHNVCTCLMDKLKDIMECSHLTMVTSSRDQLFYYLYSCGQLTIMPDEQYQSVSKLLNHLNEFTFIKKNSLHAPMFEGHFPSSSRIGIFPIHFENQKLGALFVGCQRECRCPTRELELIYHALQECAGALSRAASHTEMIQSTHGQINQPVQFCGIVGKDRHMQDLFTLIKDIAPTDAAVLIQGESGTGKELVARAIHDQSPRKDMPFIVINCSAYPSSLLESELFGHEKGAFTGAIRQKSGRFEQADGGTVFMDEIGEIAPSAQIKLLRVLQTHTFERIGGEQSLHVRVRIIAATNKDLIEEVQNGRFREDLYYRLNVIPIHLPPLRKRNNDIPLLARHFLKQFNQEQGKSVKDFKTEAMRRLLDYPWPGNVRELENTIEHALVLTRSDYIEVSSLPLTLRSQENTHPTHHQNTMVENEKKLFHDILEETGWNKKRAAKRLGISRSTLYNKIKKYNLLQPTLH